MSERAAARFVPAFLATALLSVALRAEESVRAQRAALEASFEQQLSQIAAKCDELGLSAEAKITRAWLPPRDPHRLYLFLPPHEVAAPAPAEASPTVRFWREAFAKARRAHAEKLFALAKSSLNADCVRDVYLLLHETLRHDPAHAEARRIVGAAAVAEPVARPVRTRHPKFSWPPGEHWKIDAPHYEVKTNHSREAGMALAKELETLYDAWRQTFAEFWLTEAELRRAFEGGSLPPGPRRKFQVVLFRDRAEYVAQLRAAQPQIELSEGYYATDDRTAYFFVAAETAQSTWRHEGTHQIFYEWSEASPRVGLAANFWAVEAPALYMESLAWRDGYATVGGFDAERLQYARFRALSEGVAQPLAELVRLGRDELQAHPQIRSIYSQAAGLGHFFLDGDNDGRRRAFLRYVAAVHQGRDRAETLAQMTDAPYDELGRQYRAFLDVTDADLASAQPPANIAMLSLGGTSVTDAGLAHLVRYTHLRWLNLAGTRVTDAGMAHVGRLHDLRQLYLNGTVVSDAGLTSLAGLAKLETLDTEGSRITDRGWRLLRDQAPGLKPAE